MLHGLAAAAALSMGGCSATAILSATTPGPGAIVRDLPYAPGARHGLDVYTPSRSGRAPVVVFIYGGSWERGDRDIYAFVGKALARRGFVAVIPDYRVYPEVGYPEFLRDNARAVRWTRDHVSAYGGDPGRMFLLGHSAGAYNAVMLALDERWLGEVGLDSRRDVRAAAGLSGPYDFLPLREQNLKAIFGPEAGWRDTQPIAHVDGNEPPLLLATGGADQVVDPGNSSRLAARVREAGGEAELKVYPKLGHQLAIGAFAGPLRGTAPVLADTIDFFRRHDSGAGAMAGGGFVPPPLPPQTSRR